MPQYNYICKDCVDAAEKKLGRELTEDEQVVLLFETSHAMFPTVEEALKATQCPLCDGHNTKITLLEVTQHTLIRGGNWQEFRAKNASALRRDMALHQLQDGDPYGYMRQPGEKDDLAHRLRTGGKKQTDKKHFMM
jgi:hypothetical protein